MPEVAVVTDSLACLTREFVKQYEIGIVPISIYFREKIYRDWIDITPNEAYQLLLQDPEAFATSPSSPGQFLEAYREASQRARSILCITISSKLSTSFQIANLAREQAQTELPGVSIEVMDSLSVTASEGFIVMAAARAAAQGKTLFGVKEAAERVGARANFVLLLETIKHVYRTGRIPKIAARVGSLLSIKPILTMSTDGSVHFSGAVRNKEQGVERIIAIVKQKVGEKPAHIAVMHAYAPEEGQRLMERLRSEFNCAEIWLTEFSPVMGYATGLGTVGFAYYTSE